MTTHDGTAAAAAAVTAAAAQTTHPTATTAVVDADPPEPSPSERPADVGDAAVATTPTPAADVQPVAADGEVTATAVDDENVQQTPEAAEPSPVTTQSIATEVSVLRGMKNCTLETGRYRIEWNRFRNLEILKCLRTLTKPEPKPVV